MESSQITGDAGECHSNESGWTMYIGSSIDADNDRSKPGDADGDKDSVGEYSDDSMVSDASSGPSHPLESGEGCFCRIVEVKHVDQELYGSKHGAADRKAKKPKQQKKMNERITENEEKIFNEKKCKASVQVSGDKVRKSLSWETRNDVLGAN